MCTVPDDITNAVQNDSIEEMLREWNCEQIYWYENNSDCCVAEFFDKLMKALYIEFDEFDYGKALRRHRSSLPNNRLNHTRSQQCSFM